MPIICFGQADFIATFQSDNGGFSNNQSVTFPIESASGYQVDFNNDGDLLDAGEATVHTTNFTHDFGVAGTYTVRIVGNLDRIFYNNSGANDEEKILSIDQWGTASAWTTMDNAFNGCIHLTIPATDAPNFSICTDLTQMFDRATSLNSPMDHWDVSNITTMTSMFRDADVFNQPLNSWDVSSVTTMNAMFINAVNFNQPLNNWDVSSVLTMTSMFRNTTSFNQPLNAWDMSNVRNTNNMFRGTTNFNQPLNAWDLSSDTITKNMFRDADDFNQPLDTWDMSNVTEMGFMFRDNDIFNQPLNMWDVSNVTTMAEMFRGAIAFDQPLDAWDVSSVSNMSSTFRDATDFNQSLGTWDISSATNMTNMLNSVGMDCINYDATLIGWEAQGVTGLSLGAIGLTYDTGLTARTALTSTHGWTISGDANLVGCGAILLPIKLLNFNANLEGSTVYLDWQTATETNNDYFTVQRSKNAIDWESVIDLSGAGNSTGVLSYRTQDIHPIAGTSYYRLIQTDFDGAYTYSPIVAVHYHSAGAMQVYPNPTNGVVTITNIGSEEGFNYEVMDVNGRVVLAGFNRFISTEVNLKNCQSGFYLIRVFNEGSENTLRIIKE